MAPQQTTPSLGAAQALQQLIERTVHVTGQDFFDALVLALTDVLDVRCALVSARKGETGTKARVLAVHDREGIITPGDYDFAGAACEVVLSGREVHWQRDLISKVQAKEVVRDWGLECYYGIPLLNAAGAVTGTLCVSDRSPVDLGEPMIALLRMAAARAGAELGRMAALQRLEHANAQLLAASSAKSDFLANMSHEIRTPMAAILGFADLLDDDDAPEIDRREAADTIRRNAEHLLVILDDILDLSKIEAGRMTVDSVPTRPREILEEVESMMRLRAMAKNLELHVEWLGDPDARLRTDPVRLRQIILNLVSNAVKFTDKGGVRIVGRMDRAAPNAPDAPESLRIEVIDTGVGMTPDQTDALFEPFVQVDSASSRRFGGAGLGLSISRRLARLMGGDITVRSRAGQGSAFTVTIADAPATGAAPLSPISDGAAAPSPPAPSLTGLRILLADDGPDNQRLLSFLLRQGGATVDVASDGAEALRLAIGWNDGPARRDAARGPYDLIVMDMQMPGIDGYEATRILRREGCATPVLALTAHAMESNRGRCLEAGCDEFLPKPASRARLLAVCAELVRLGRERGRAKSAA